MFHCRPILRQKVSNIEVLQRFLSFESAEIKEIMSEISEKILDVLKKNNILIISDN